MGPHLDMNILIDAESTYFGYYSPKDKCVFRIHKKQHKNYVNSCPEKFTADLYGSYQ